MSHATSMAASWTIWKQRQVSTQVCQTLKEIFVDFRSSCNIIAYITRYYVIIKSCKKHKQPLGIKNFEALKQPQSSSLYGFPCQMKIPTNNKDYLQHKQNYIAMRLHLTPWQLKSHTWSRKTVRPSFKLSWNQSRHVTLHCFSWCYIEVCLSLF